MEVGARLGASSSSPHSKRRLFIPSDTLSRASLSYVCVLTTPCPTPNWPLVTWKGNDAHLSPLSCILSHSSPLLMALARLCFQFACRSSWPVGSPLFIFFLLQHILRII
ncbi:unnamed protein product [Spirodela intermedia]|uniref:Uncharacterized protein n=1 Tax=Spirodela intermedia TaxID=51605 RepID=A0ABN7EBP7_SPIIN|nr:unnamed protein product [Spirodela intermedia]